MGMCKACFEECHSGPKCDSFYSRVSGSAYCDCHTLSTCKFNDKNFVRDKRLKIQVHKRREKMNVDQVGLTEEHKVQVKQIYETIVPVKFRWGGSGFLKVRTKHFA